jgi:hypothetical protein
MKEIVAAIAKEIAHWLFFSLVVGLAQPWLIPPGAPS